MKLHDEKRITWIYVGTSHNYIVRDWLGPDRSLDLYYKRILNYFRMKVHNHKINWNLISTFWNRKNLIWTNLLEYNLRCPKFCVTACLLKILLCLYVCIRYFAFVDMCACMGLKLQHIQSKIAKYIGKNRLIPCLQLCLKYQSMLW